MRLKKAVSLLLISILIFISNASIANAAIINIVANDKDINYEYDAAELNDSYTIYQIDPSLSGAELYKEFMSKKPTAFLDDVRGYVDINDVNDAYMIAQLSAEEFDPDEYAETKAVKADESVVKNLYTVTIEDGKIVYNLKEPVMPKFRFEVLDSVIVGKKTVIVELIGIEDPTLYDVYVGGQKLEYDEQFGAFRGMVLETDAVESKVKIEEKQQSEDDLRVVDIY